MIKSYTPTWSINGEPPKPAGEPTMNVTGAVSSADIVEVWRAERQLRIDAEVRAEKAETRANRLARAARMARAEGHRGPAAAPAVN